MDNLQLMKLARIEKALNQRVNFSIGVMSYKDYFLKYVVKVESILTNNMDRWDRVKFNRMYGDEQDAYEKRLKEEVIKYRAFKNDTSFIEITKLLFDGFKQLNNGLNININEVK